MKTFWLLFFCSCFSTPLVASKYKKATEGKEVVMGKMYPKKGKVELNPIFGAILNQSYINSLLVGGGLTYFWKESAGFSLDFQMAMNTDKGERICIESFYLDPLSDVADSCGPADTLEDTPKDAREGLFPRYGPAYVPIREIGYIFTGNYVWSPVYGKQLLFLSATSYFDLFLEFGGGLMMSTFFQEQNILANGNEPRAPYNEDESNEGVGASVDEDYAYGVAGRPEPVSETSPMINIGVGQKIRMGKNFHLMATARNMTLFMTSQGFENYISVTGAIGMRF